MDLANYDWSGLSAKALEFAITVVPKIALAILILVVGLWIVKKVMKLITHLLERANIGAELTGFLGSIASIALKFVVVLIAASVLGFEVGALLGILAGAVFAIGLALQGFLGNFASGITIVFFKPYKVGDWVQLGDFFGKVDSIQIFNTTLITPGDKTLIIPNGKVTDDVITNFSTQGNMRLELNVTMPYAESWPNVKEIIVNALTGYDKILQEPEPIIGIESFDSHNVVLTVRPYIHPDNYWDVTFDLNGRIKEAFSKAGIKVAYSEGVELGDIGS